MISYNKQITVIGAYGEGNVGDDLLMENLIVWLNNSFPNIIPLLVVRNKKMVERMLIGFKVDLVDDYMNYHIETRIAIYGGGTQFFDFEIADGVIFNKRKEQLYNPLATIKKRIYKKKIISRENILLGVGFGPFKSKKSKGYENFRKTLAKTSLVCVRDNTSYQLIPENFKGKLILGTDICFNSFFNKKIKKFKRDTVFFELNQKRKVGIVLRQWDYKNINQGELFATLKDYITLNSDIDFEVVLFRERKDKRVLKYFKNINNLKFFVWNSEKDDFNSFLSIYSAYDYIMTARFHGAIFCGLLNIPFITIGIEPKLSIPNKIYNNNLIFKPPFTLESLNETVINLYKNNFKYPYYNNKEIEKGDTMLKKVQQFIIKQFKNR